MVITICNQSFFSLLEGEEKEQDIFAGQGSRKQGKQGLEYLKTKTQISHTPKNTHQILHTPQNTPLILYTTQNIHNFAQTLKLPWI